MEISDEAREARDILQSVIKAKKACRMYPENNPIYIKTLEETYARFNDYFTYKDDYTLHITQHSITYDSEQIYYNKEKEDNLALFFFKDGLRELSFKKGLLQEELDCFALRRKEMLEVVMPALPVVEEPAARSPVPDRSAAARPSGRLSRSPDSAP